MRLNRQILKRWAICSIMLTIQLVSFSLPVLSAHRQMAAESGLLLTGQEHRHGGQAEADEKTGHEIHKTFKNRRKQRLYIPASARQYSFENHAVFQFSQNPALSIFIAENKTGEYRFQYAFLPAYYYFLFRLTPF